MSNHIVKLTPEQASQLRKSHTELLVIDTVMESLIKKLIQEKAKQEDDFWVQIYSLLNRDQGSGKVTIRWISQELIFTPYEDIDQ
jgi:hypothetical protein